jgi:hypothetical protein
VTYLQPCNPQLGGTNVRTIGRIRTLIARLLQDRNVFWQFEAGLTMHIPSGVVPHGNNKGTENQFGEGTP